MVCCSHRFSLQSEAASARSSSNKASVIQQHLPSSHHSSTSSTPASTLSLDRTTPPGGSTHQQGWGESVVKNLPELEARDVDFAHGSNSSESTSMEVHVVECDSDVISRKPPKLRPLTLSPPSHYSVHNDLDSCSVGDTTPVSPATTVSSDVTTPEGAAPPGGKKSKSRFSKIASFARKTRLPSFRSQRKQ